MYGTNPIAKVRQERDSFLVKEVFYTIQGEGPWTGYPTIFVRLAGCNLACDFCDTDFSGGSVVSVDNLALRLNHLIKTTGCYRIVLTGGEPMLQNLPALIQHVDLTNAVFQIETAGTIWPAGLEKGIHGGKYLIVCSPKTPDINPFVRDAANAFKYIVSQYNTSDVDGLPMAKFGKGEELKPVFRPPQYKKHLIWVQPMDVDGSEGHGHESIASVQKAVEVCMKFGYRLSLQTHKIIGVP